MKKHTNIKMMFGLLFALAALMPNQTGADDGMPQDMDDEGKGSWWLYEGATHDAPAIMELPGFGETSETRWTIDVVPLGTDTGPLDLFLPGGRVELEYSPVPESFEVFFPPENAPPEITRAGDGVLVTYPEDTPAGTLALAGGWTLMMRVSMETESDMLMLGGNRWHRSPASGKNQNGKGSHAMNPKASGQGDASATHAGAATKPGGNPDKNDLRSSRMPEILCGNAQSRLNRTRDEHQRMRVTIAPQPLD